MIKRVTAMLALATLAAVAAELPRKSPELAIGLDGGKQVLLSQFQGKAVAVCFILTTCPHCQKTIGFLTKMQNEYGPKGFQVLASAIQRDAARSVPGFIQTYHPPFPVGFNSDMTALDFMQHPPMLGPHMPLLAFIDRQGII